MNKPDANKASKATNFPASDFSHDELSANKS
jgi:hypothetical protein